MAGAAWVWCGVVCLLVLQEEYRAEGIPVEHIVFVDNQNTLDLLEG